jgi:hypothetical protein
MKRFKEVGMVDVAIAANFVRELTEEQFEERQRPPRRMAQAGGRPAGTGAAAGGTLSRPAGTGAAAGGTLSRTAGTGAAAGGTVNRPAGTGAAAEATVNRARVAARRPAVASSRRGRFAGTRFGRALYRLAQVRG